MTEKEIQETKQQVIDLVQEAKKFAIGASTVMKILHMQGYFHLKQMEELTKINNKLDNISMRLGKVEKAVRDKK